MARYLGVDPRIFRQPGGWIWFKRGLAVMTAENAASAQIRERTQAR